MKESNGAGAAYELPPEQGDCTDDPTLAAAAVAYWLVGKRAEKRGSPADVEGGVRAPQSGVRRGFKRVELTESGVLRRPSSAPLLGEQLVQQLGHTYRLAQIGMLSAGVAHEVSNPLTYIYANTLVVQDHTETLATAFKLLAEASRPAPPERHAAIARQLAELDPESCLGELLEMCQRNLSGLAQVCELMGSVKQLAREAPDQGSVLLHEVVRDTVRLVSKTLERRALLSLDLQPVPPLPGEATSLAQVVLNLLMNAAHALDQTRGRQRRISLATQVAGDQAVLVVEDTGCGMSHETQRRIFEPFFTTKPAGEGTGLGLTLSLDIARRHGGALRCESALGSGSRFELSLPIPAPVDA